MIENREYLQLLRELTTTDGLFLYAEGEIIYHPSAEGIVVETRVPAIERWLSVWSRLEKSDRLKSDKTGVNADDINFDMEFMKPVESHLLASPTTIINVERGEERLRIYAVPSPNYSFAHAVAYYHLLITGSHPATIDTFLTLIMLSA